MDMTDGVKAVCHAGTLFRVWLVKHSLVPFSGGPGFVGVDPWNDQKLVLCVLLNLYKAAGVVQNRIFIVSRAGTDDNHKFLAFPGYDFFCFLVPHGFCQSILGGKGELFFDFCRCRQLVDKFETHNGSPLFSELFCKRLSL